MKKILVPILILMFFAVSCSSSKKTENDTDILPDEDEITDENADEPDEDEDENDEDEETVTVSCEQDPCENIAKGDGTCTDKEDGSFECGCVEGYFWDGENCVDPCEDVSCSQFAHASGICEPKDAFSFSCDCDEGYFWGYLGCKKTSFPNFCTKFNFCSNNSYTACPDAYYAKLGYCIKQSFSRKQYYTDDDLTDSKTGTTLFDDYLKIEWIEEIPEETCAWEDALKYCEELEYAGYDDWRLPTLRELYYSDASGKNDLWSSTEYAWDTSDAWILSSRGVWLLGDKTGSSYIHSQCVRGEPVNETVSFDTLGKVGEEVAFDYENGLAWQLRGGAVHLFAEALEYCGNSNYSGFSDWRLPNINELASLINHAKTDPATDLPLHLTEDLSWTSTLIYSDAAAGVNFRNGELGFLYKTEDAAQMHLSANWGNILCVRNEPCKKGHIWNGRKCIVSPCIDEPCRNKEHSDGVCYLNDFESHLCGCAEGYFRDGENCVSPCDPDPCRNDKHSTGECTAISLDLHECGCIEGYFWDGKKCVNPCAGVSCGDFEHAKGKCKTDNAFTFKCNCVESYFWWGKDKGCLKERPAAANICTGQTKCYDNEKEIPCPAENEEFFGQDAQYARLGYCIPQSFSINTSVLTEPVVVDNNLGLMWQRTIPPAKELYIEDVLAYCENLVYGGYDDWRLPSTEEFMTIADYGKYDPAVNTVYFPDSGKFWTSTINEIWFLVSLNDDVAYENRCTIFDFADNSTPYVVTLYAHYSPENRAYSFNIRCIRGESSVTAPDYFISETLGKDTMWNNYNDLIFIKTEEKQTWQEALKYCSELDYAGISDWRLPNIKEITFNPNIQGITFNPFSGSRSSTTKPGDPASDYISLPYDLPAKEEKTADTFCVANDPCENGRFWNGVKCSKNPCAGNPCSNVSFSVHQCIVVDEGTYSCGCYPKYFWNPDKKECLRSCEGNPCYDHDNSNHECYPHRTYGYRCGCVENFYWDLERKQCMLDCDSNPCKKYKHSNGKCYFNGTEEAHCGCEKGYKWFPYACVEDLCNPNPCENAANSDGTCEQTYHQYSSGYNTSYSCNCLEGYKWDYTKGKCR